MTDLDRLLVRRKLRSIVDALETLAEIRGLTLAEYLAHRISRKAAERLLQQMAETAVDLNMHLLRVAHVKRPVDYHGSFTEAGRAGILPNDLARRLAPATGMRNRLVHEYDQIDDTIVHAAIGEACELFPEYVDAVERYLATA